jgi:hypothetical protein
MSRMGMIDSRDMAINHGTNDSTSLTSANAPPSVDQSIELTGEECWLQYVAFDVVYFDGPTAKEALESACSAHLKTEPGPLLHLNGFERKKLLYYVVEAVPRHVEFVETLVVRPTGHTMSGDRYFNCRNPVTEFGFPVYSLDSIDCAFCGVVPSLPKIDVQRQRMFSDEQISLARAQAVDGEYQRLVENQRNEGLLIKDLSTPYFLGPQSKALGYWHKFKPDYYSGSAASDLDVVIVGAYYAIGKRLAGTISSFLLAW